MIWEEFDVDYDTIFADTATFKGKNVNEQIECHTMTMNEIKQINNDLSFGPNPKTPSTASSQIPTPPPLPIIHNGSTHDQQLNDDFWNDLINSATPSMLINQIFFPSNVFFRAIGIIIACKKL